MLETDFFKPFLLLPQKQPYVRVALACHGDISFRDYNEDTVVRPSAPLQAEYAIVGPSRYRTGYVYEFHCLIRG